MKILLTLFVLFFSSLVFAEGCTSGDCTNGFGTYTTANGDKYVGEFKDNKYEGQGTYTSASGDKYVGEWKDGKNNGQGTATFANGRVMPMEELEKVYGKMANSLRKTNIKLLKTKKGSDRPYHSPRSL